MINRKEAKITNLVIHQLGNKSIGTNLRFSSSCAKIKDDNLTSALLTYFIVHFNAAEFFTFSYINDDFDLNPLYNLVGNIFDNPLDLYKISISIAKLLQEKSDNKNIRGGDLFIAHIDDILIEDEMTSALAIVKCEEKQDYLKTQEIDNTFIPKLESGISIGKVDNSCLIFNTQRDSGFKVLTTDHINKNGGSKFWIEEFLNLKQTKNDYAETKEFIRFTSDFIKKKFGAEDEEIMTEAQFLSKTHDYFKSKDRIGAISFKEEVLKHPQLIEKFDKYRNEYAKTKGYQESAFEQVFELSDLALKHHKRVFRSIIKLDSNFHIYVHGDHKKIKKGIDEQGRKYYILYYDDEK
jgi:hypothetical protein